MSPYTQTTALQLGIYAIISLHYIILFLLLYKIFGLYSTKGEKKITELGLQFSVTRRPNRRQPLDSATVN
jgi:hypothetical protein